MAGLYGGYLSVLTIPREHRSHAYSMTPIQLIFTKIKWRREDSAGALLHGAYNRCAGARKVPKSDRQCKFDQMGFECGRSLAFVAVRYVFLGCGFASFREQWKFGGLTRLLTDTCSELFMPSTINAMLS
jgi:hypothetical protein